MILINGLHLVVTLGPCSQTDELIHIMLESTWNLFTSLFDEEMTKKKTAFPLNGFNPIIQLHLTLKSRILYKEKV